MYLVCSVELTELLAKKCIVTVKGFLLRKKVRQRLREKGGREGGREGGSCTYVHEHI